MEGDRKTKAVIASWNAKLPDNPNARDATWSLGPGGCVLVELTRTGG